jgi:hypothetical protein
MQLTPFELIQFVAIQRRHESLSLLRDRNTLGVRRDRSSADILMPTAG